MRFIAFCLFAAAVAAQDPKFAYPSPPDSEIAVRKDIAYANQGGKNLLMDVYAPSKPGPTSRFPAIVLLSAGGSQRDMDFYVAWAKAATAHGFVAINPDGDQEHFEENFDVLLAYLAQHAADLHIDSGAIAVYAGSGNVYRGFPLVENAKRTAIKAAVMYYGGAEVKEFRLDLPVLYIRAGLDRPRVNREIGEIAAAAVLQNAPITIVNYSGGHHGFEMMDDNDATREVLEQTFHFLHSVLSPRYQSALHANITEASAAGAVVMRDFPKAATLYRSLIAQGNTEPRMILSYGEALVGAHRYKEARIQFDRLRPLKVLGPRDLGLPAAAACALDGDPVAAIDWLKTIPKRFLPRTLLEDETFASLRERPDFKELFQ